MSSDHENQPRLKGFVGTTRPHTCLCLIGGAFYRRAWMCVVSQEGLTHATLSWMLGNDESGGNCGSGKGSPRPSPAFWRYPQRRPDMHTRLCHTSVQRLSWCWLQRDHFAPAKVILIILREVSFMQEIVQYNACGSEIRRKYLRSLIKRGKSVQKCPTGLSLSHFGRSSRLEPVVNCQDVPRMKMLFYFCYDLWDKNGHRRTGWSSSAPGRQMLCWLSGMTQRAELHWKHQNKPWKQAVDRCDIPGNIFLKSRNERCFSLVSAKGKEMFSISHLSKRLYFWGCQKIGKKHSS